MLSREKRLTDTRDFKRVYQRGSFLGSAFFSVNFLPNRRSLSRVGFVVSKKAEAKAVKRNLLKRKFREAAASLYESLPAGYDVVVNIKPKAKEIDFVGIKKEIELIFRKVGTSEAPRHRNH